MEAAHADLGPGRPRGLRHLREPAITRFEERRRPPGRRKELLNLADQLGEQFVHPPYTGLNLVDDEVRDKEGRNSPQHLVDLVHDLLYLASHTIKESLCFVEEFLDVLATPDTDQCAHHFSPGVSPLKLPAPVASSSR